MPRTNPARYLDPLRATRTRQESARLIGCGDNKVTELFETGVLTVVRIGNRDLATVVSLEKLLGRPIAELEAPLRDTEKSEAHYRAEAAEAALRMSSGKPQCETPSGRKRVTASPRRKPHAGGSTGSPGVGHRAVGSTPTRRRGGNRHHLGRHTALWQPTPLIPASYLIPPPITPTSLRSSIPPPPHPPRPSPLPLPPPPPLPPSLLPPFLPPPSSPRLLLATSVPLPFPRPPPFSGRIHSGLERCTHRPALSTAEGRPVHLEGPMAQSSRPAQSVPADISAEAVHRHLESLVRDRVHRPPPGAAAGVLARLLQLGGGRGAFARTCGTATARGAPSAFSRRSPFRRTALSPRYRAGHHDERKARDHPVRMASATPAQPARIRRYPVLVRPSAARLPGTRHRGPDLGRSARQAADRSRWSGHPGRWQAQICAGGRDPRPRRA